MAIWPERAASRMSEPTRRCRPYAAGTPSLTVEQVEQRLPQVPGWVVQDGRLVRTFTFKNYYRTSAFVNAVVWIAHTEDHHPDITFGYKTCTVRYATHSVEGLSDNDFICAAQVSTLVSEEAG